MEKESFSSNWKINKVYIDDTQHQHLSDFFISAFNNLCYRYNYLIARVASKLLTKIRFENQINLVTTFQILNKSMKCTSNFYFLDLDCGIHNRSTELHLGKSFLRCQEPPVYLGENG